MDEVVLRVLARYPALLRQGPLEPLGNRGGFSGARLWRLTAPAGPLCLRCAAAAETAAHLAWRHRLMALAQNEGLLFVPAVHQTSEGGSVVEAGGRCWELMEWLPGQADYRAHPSRPRLEATARALARVHDVWRAEARGTAVCPAVVRRLGLARGWTAPAVPLAGLVERIRAVLRLWMPRVPGWLQPWQAWTCVVQPCLRDVWHENLLFEGERLTGLVDYAAVDQDGVAVDLARMLGSLVEDDEADWQTALAAYRQVRALSAEEEAVARVLDRAGVVLGLANWLRWLLAGQRRQDNAAPARAEELLRRIESWPPGLPVSRSRIDLPPNAGVD